MRKMFTAIVTTVALTFTVAPLPVAAQQGGLVNVAIGDITTGDILSNITVNAGVGLNVAANVCGVAVGVLAQQLGQTGAAHCETAEQFVDVSRLGR